MSDNISEAFARQLLEKNQIADLADLNTTSSDLLAIQRTLRKLWELTDLSASDFADEVARFYRLPRVSLPQLTDATPLTAGFSARFLRENNLFPYQTEDACPRLAVADPSDPGVTHAVELVLGAPVTVGVASFEDISTALNEHASQQDDTAASAVGTTLARADDDVDILRDLASGAPVVRAVNDLLERAMELRASDIHIEPFRNDLVVRLRVDGLLRVVPSPSGAPPQALISRIKILAGLNIAERRLPQDGAARLRVGRSEIDIRVATMPTQHGESAVIRLLPRDRGLLDVTKLGLCCADEARIAGLLGLPYGMIVVTGPTGSGKTTTLATMLSVLNQSTRKILTIEDPVEYELRGVNQSQVKPSIGLTFAAVMRAFVRQDPDVIMVGEIRDTETAHIAVHAALTGHLVLTTLHTDTAAAAVPRLLDLGAEGFLLKSTLRATIAQRLVRVLCDRCKKRKLLTAHDMAADPRYAAIGFAVGETVYEPSGCERCGENGYRGRIGVFEILEMSDIVRPLVGSDASEIDRAARRAGMTTMVEDGVAKCRAGVTSIAEVLRVTTVR
jgi:general secretion pathway protein E